jgi:prepilin-type N-terminal cleavage/methylation domain-containing protein
MKNSKGFTLIEITIVAVIGGILIVSLSNLLTTYLNQSKRSSTERKLATIKDALQLHLELRGRYPCVASSNAAFNTPQFGVEIADCSDAAAPPSTFGTTGVDGLQIRIGAVPVRTLNLPDDFIGDAWGGRFTYAVTATLADPDDLFDRENGDISVIDSATPANSLITPAGSAHYVLVSHGPNNSGARNLGGGGAAACDAADLEGENCDNDDVFLSTLVTSLGNDTFDDLVSIRSTTLYGQIMPTGAIVAFNLSSCPVAEGWASFPAASGRFIRGLGAAGDNLGDQDGRSRVNLDIDKTNIRVFGTDVNVALDVDSSPDNNLPPYIALTYCIKIDTTAP